MSGTILIVTILTISRSSTHAAFEITPTAVNGFIFLLQSSMTRGGLVWSRGPIAGSAKRLNESWRENIWALW